MSRYLVSIALGLAAFDISFALNLAGLVSGERAFGHLAWGIVAGLTFGFVFAFKARFFASLGFTAHNWRELDAALRSQHLPESATPGPVEAFGQSFTIRAILKGPSGGALVTSVWFVRTGEAVAQFVTAYPGGKA